MRLACWLKGAPMLVNMHSPYLKRGRYTLGLHLADRVVAVASAIAEPLLAGGMEADRVGVVYNGFDAEAVLQGDATALRGQLGIPEGAVVGAIAGSLIRRKGHDILFEAMKHPAVNSRPFHLLVAGEGPERAALTQLAAGLPIHFLGQRPDLGAVLRDAADLLVAPSRQEAFGRVIIEAAFAGIPAIGARVDGIPEAIVDNVTGLLAPPEDPIALARAMARLIDDAALRRTLGAAARERAAAQFSIRTCADKMQGEYAAMLRRHQAGRSWGSALRRLEPLRRLLPV
jgi:glycosyltransferase involved in cell wall biosynthesis